MLSWALPASACPGGGRILGCVPAPCAPGPALLDSRSRPAAPSAEPPPEPLRAAPAPPCALQPLGSSEHSPGAQVSVSVPGSPRASPPSWVLLHLPASPFPPAREGWCSSCSSGTGLSCPGDTRPGLSPAPRGAPPPRRPFVPLSLFPRLPTLIEARTLLTVAFQLVSLYISGRIRRFSGWFEGYLGNLVGTGDLGTLLFRHLAPPPLAPFLWP